jgi:tripartite-type tricarboxylate transporter receptor subunit TctC
MKAITVGLLAGLTVVMGNVCAQTPPPPYPSKPIRLVVPYPPGAANDILARALAQRLGPALGQNIVVDNRAGGGGHIGAEAVSRAPADGYTLLIGTSGLITIGPNLYPKLPYNPQRDLMPVVRFATVPYVFAVPASLGISKASELAALAKSKPGGLKIASAGNGSVPHLCGELFNLRAGVKMVHVPYKGGAQAVTDLIAGQVQLYCGGIPTVLTQVKAGKLRLAGVTSKARTPLLPDEPTLAEQGISGVEVNSWTGILVPAGTPAAVVTRLHRETERIMKSDEMRQYVINQGAEAEAVGPAEFAEAIKAETLRWGAVVKASGAKVD